MSYCMGWRVILTGTDATRWSAKDLTSISSKILRYAQNDSVHGVV